MHQSVMQAQTVSGLDALYGLRGTGAVTCCQLQQLGFGPCDGVLHRLQADSHAVDVTHEAVTTDSALSVCPTAGLC